MSGSYGSWIIEYWKLKTVSLQGMENWGRVKLVEVLKKRGKVSYFLL